jgi:RHS repeat-associated protein
MKRLLTTVLACLAILGTRPTYASEFDAETGLVHMGAREYDPETGRFLQEDPEYHPGQNSFMYALNNPLKYIDPLGTDVILAQQGFWNHQVVYIGDPTHGYTTFEFGPADENARLLVPYDWAGHAYWIPGNQTIKGDILKSFPQDPNQDQFSILEAKFFLNSARWKKYNLYSNNCQTFGQSLYKNLTPSMGPP